MNAKAIIKRSTGGPPARRAPRIRLPLARRLGQVFAAIGYIGAVGTLYQLFGYIAVAAGVLVPVAAALPVVLVRQRRRIKQLEDRLAAELPPQHAFLVEFLRTTYAPPRNDVLIERNNGLNIQHYQNDFAVSGSDCVNAQKIEGTNLSTLPARGVAFAVVGGSSMSATELSSEYTANDGPMRRPAFIVDEERFKVAFCEFDVPIPLQSTFTIAYSDEWRGAMRGGADGFFFPEALYFPSAINRLASRLEFSFPIASIGVLCANISDATVSLCESQPCKATPRKDMVAAFTWSVQRPPNDTIYVLYYCAA